MTTMSKTPALVKPRLELRLRSDESFDDDLGLFGQNVGPRLGPGKRSQADKEDWCLRRFLIALRKIQPAKFPLMVRAYPPSEDSKTPDFMIDFADGVRLGIEVTEATCEKLQRDLTVSERAGPRIAFVFGPGGDGFAGDAVERMLVDQISQAIERKMKKVARKRYADTPMCDLLIYANTDAPLPDWNAVLDRLSERWSGKRQPFRQVHLLRDDVVRFDLFGTQTEVSVRESYEHDFLAWLEEQAKAARDGRRGALDLPNLAEELESLARTERRSFRSHLRNLLVHLLKWEHQPERRSTSWTRSIMNSRRALEDLLSDSPSLGTPQFLTEALAAEYLRARERAIKEARLTADSVAPECPYDWDAVLDSDFPWADVPRGEG